MCLFSLKVQTEKAKVKTMTFKRQFSASMERVYCFSKKVALLISLPLFPLSTLSLSLSYLSLSSSPLPFYSRAHTFTRTQFPSHTHTHTLSLSLSLYLYFPPFHLGTHTFTHTHILFPFLSLSHTHKHHRHTHFLYLTHTFILYSPLSLFANGNVSPQRVPNWPHKNQPIKLKRRKKGNYAKLIAIY
jgi:hypothetical protein